MSLPAAPKVPPQVAEQAVRWLVELQGGADDERLRQAWQRWRQAAPEHEQAWRHIEAVNQRLAGIARHWPWPPSTHRIRRNAGAR